MKRQAGFTLIELMAVIAIVGILAATSVYMYGEYRQRATGAEAQLVLKNILDAQIIYFLENEDFYPAVGPPLIIPSDAIATAATQTNIDLIKGALKLTLPVGHNMEYTLINNGPGGFLLRIEALFDMFPGGERELWGFLTTDGKIDIWRAG